MSARIETEVSLLRSVYPDLEYQPEGYWVRIPVYRLPDGIWSRTEVEVSFQIPAGIPGEAPYGFYVRPQLALASGTAPNNYTYGTPTPFGSDWGKFSWALEPWAPHAEVTSGSNMLNFARSFYGRFTEGA
jgi:Prokaryotic E2 family E